MSRTASLRLLLLFVVVAGCAKAAFAGAHVMAAWDATAEANWWPIFRDSRVLPNAGLMLMGAAGLLLLPTRLATGWLTAFHVLLSITALVDTVHAHFYGDAFSIAELSSLRFLTLAALMPGFNWSQLWFVADWPVVMWLAARSYRSESVPSVRSRVQLAVPALVAGILLIAPAIGQLASLGAWIASGSAVPKLVIARAGLIAYHTLDFVWSGSPVRSASQADIDAVRSFLDGQRQRPPGPLTGIALGRNVVVISAESLHTFVIGLKIDGKPVAPVLTQLASESLYFSRFQDETFLGTTSDAELGVLQGLHPLPTGVVVEEYWRNGFRGWPRILAERGYSTLSAAAEPREFWRMSDMHARMGFARSLFDEFFTGPTRVGEWLGDRDFFEQAVPVLADLPEPFASLLIASSNHIPYVLPESLRTFDAGAHRGSLLGRYLETVHYFDKSLGHFLDLLRTTGLLDRTVLVVYGDHQAFLSDTPELAAILGRNGSAANRYELWRARKQVPLLIRLPAAAAAGESRKAGGHVDVPSTILGLLGVDDSAEVMLGRDLTGTQPGFAVFRDGSFDFDGQHYISDFSAGVAACFRTDDGSPIDCTPLDTRRAEAAERLRISDLIVRQDLIPRLTSNSERANVDR